MNPFDVNVDEDFLLNIATGKAAKDETAQFLLTVEERGEKLRETFINECLVNPARFEQRIKRNKILNSPSENVKKKNKIAGKVQEIRMQPDLFGRLLGVSIDFNVDIARAMCYLVTPIQLSLCHLDGKINKCQKSILTH